MTAFTVADEDFTAVERARSAMYASATVLEAVPVFIRHMTPLNRNLHRHETRYARRGYGPTNRSGKARS